MRVTESLVWLMLIARSFVYLICLLLRHSGFFSSVTSPKTHVDRSCTLCSPCRDPFGLPVVGVFFVEACHGPTINPPLLFWHPMVKKRTNWDWKSRPSVGLFLFSALSFILILRWFVGEVPLVASLKPHFLQLSRPCFIRCIFMS